MILSGLEIEHRMGQDIVIEPYDRKLLNPNSYNLRLSDELLVYKNNVLDMALPNEAEKLSIPPDSAANVPDITKAMIATELTLTPAISAACRALPVAIRSRPNLV